MKRCSHCGQTAEDRASFCEYCGSPLPHTDVQRTEEPIVHKPIPSEPSIFDEPIPSSVPKAKPKKQIFRWILIVFLALTAIASFYSLRLMGTVDAESILAKMFEDEAWLLLNVLTVFLPALVIMLFAAVGWLAIIFVDAVAIIISLLTMIRAHKLKKIILLVLIACFLIMAIYAGVVRPGMPT